MRRRRIPPAFDIVFALYIPNNFVNSIRLKIITLTFLLIVTMESTRVDIFPN